MAEQPPLRRRFQFRLRTLMIVVTIFCVTVGGYVGWQAKIVRERKAYLQSHTHKWIAGPQTIKWFAGGDRTRSPTAIRLLLGDEMQEEVWIRHDASDGEKQAVAALFPESVVWED